MGSERCSRSFLFINRDIKSESFPEPNSDKASTINCHAQGWHSGQLRQGKSLPGPEKELGGGNTPLLFINKGQDATSLTRSKDAEAAIINSHSQRWRNH